MGTTGPASLVVLILYKLFDQFKVRRETGSWIDKSKSNYYKPKSQQKSAASVNNDDEFTNV